MVVKKIGLSCNTWNRLTTVYLSNYLRDLKDQITSMQEWDSTEIRS